MADFELSRSTLQFVIKWFGAPKIPGALPEEYAAMVRSAIVRDLLTQLDFHGIVASYRPRLTIPSTLLFRSAISFAMAHEAAHLLIGESDSPEARLSSHIRADGTIADSQWGRELAQDRLALRLSRHVASTLADRFGRVPGFRRETEGDVAKYLTSAKNTEIESGKCLNLLRARGRDALPEVLDLLGVDAEEILGSTQLSRRSVAQIIDHSDRIHMPSGKDRRTYVDIWANVVSAALREAPDRNRILYHLLDFDEDRTEAGPGTAPS
ncbi:hypothetical protein ACTMTF_43000 [Nonomuraea sp. ZG12]|uniref:hypothetical protein n=1 Tax=Nonomuraea sp. ZG12 TaxID=3452207 RepID=UPI003F8AC401